MADEYTPTVDEVCDGYVNGRWDDGVGVFRDASEPEFRRWLAEHDRQVRAEAWDEGVGAASGLDLADVDLLPNPYRKARR